jgi:EmrB/QacA subfamily drug resistance transporter
MASSTTSEPSSLEAPKPPVEASGNETNYLSHDQIMVVVVGLMAGMFLAALDQSIVGTALPRIVSDLGGLDKLSWVVTAYLLTSTAVTPLWGKISDLYGRRAIFQAAIVIFLIGSALCGIAQNMPQLIGFRALQGIGGGGLLAIAFSIIGDIIPPRERGRYQGYFGAVWGASAVAGPLLGGWFTDGPGWRWIFYINIPVGIVALAIISIVLKLPLQKREHSIDYLGAALIVAAVSALLLYLDWAGKNYGWGSSRALGLIVAAIVLVAIFIFVELRAKEPIIPMRLFRNSIFTTANLFGFLFGFAMFGSSIFLPLYLQAVKGMSPTRSGMALLPTVVGMMTFSILAGQLITRKGRYKIYPVIGSVVVILALLVLSQLSADAHYAQVALGALLFGAGMGLTMQTVVVAVQNSVEYRDMGVATSSATFFRSLGGAIGTAVLGAILTSRLDHHLADRLDTAGATIDRTTIDANNIESIRALTEPARSIVGEAFTSATNDVFLSCLPFIVAALIVVLFLKEVPLRTGKATSETVDDPVITPPSH